MQCSCGAETDSVHGGRPECQACWNWRKLDGPAARYWHKAIPQLFEQGPDGWDIRTWSRLGIIGQVSDAVSTLKWLQAFYWKQLKEHGEIK